MSTKDNVNGSEKITWGPHKMPDSEATGHFLAVGASGSGKSTLLQLLMQSALPRIGIAPDRRALIYDAKQDILPLLAAICPHAKVVTAHPYDQRGAAWDICRDVQDPAVAMEIAFTLIPKSHESQPFFSDAARHLLYGVIQSFILTGEPWTLGTLVRAMQTREQIRSVLCRHPEISAIANQYLGDGREAESIMSTISTKMLTLMPIAASWDTATEKFSLEDWVTGNWILVLGNYETGRAAIDAINRCLFKRATDLILNQPNSFSRRTWLILDELSEMGKMDGLVPLMKKGRSKGACTVLAFQSIQGLRDHQFYGPQMTDEITGQVSHRAILKLECVETANWASNLFGDQEHEEESYSESTGAGGTSRSVNRQRASRRLVLPSEFMDLEACNRENGLSGYYIVRLKGAFFENLAGDTLWGVSVKSPQADVPEFIPRPASVKLLKPWSAEEEARFGSGLRERERDPEKDIRRDPPPPEEPRDFDDLDQHFQ